MTMTRKQLKSIRRAKNIRHKRNVERAKRKAEGIDGYQPMFFGTKPSTNKHAYRLWNI